MPKRLRKRRFDLGVLYLTLPIAVLALSFGALMVTSIITIILGAEYPHGQGYWTLLDWGIAIFGIGGLTASIMVIVYIGTTSFLGIKKQDSEEQNGM